LAIERAPTTTPSAVTDPVRSRTANANAIGAIELPSRLTVLATTSHRKGGRRSTFNDAGMSPS